ncbi:MAG: hypothetical protein HC850_08005 [Rhodomicrobium sp.]|nr:hypothetical protein [Rhodomicrobium sp.]
MLKIVICGAIVAAPALLFAGLSAIAPRADAGGNVKTEIAGAAPDASGHAFPDPQAAARSSWEKRWWIDKTARLLRAGDGLGPADDIQRLEAMPEAEIARSFMKDERFGDAVLDFNMYFLGFKVDGLKVDGVYSHNAYDFANAIGSAKAVLDGGDYLKLFDLEGDYYMAPLTMVPSEDTLDPKDARLTPRQLRQKAGDELKTRLKALIAMRAGKTPIDHDELCDEVGEFTDRQEDITKQFFRAFTDTEIFVLMRGGVPEFLFDALNKTLNAQCEASGSAGQPEPERIEETLQTALAQLDRALDEIAKFEPTVYGPDTVAEMKTLDRAAFPASKPWLAFGFEQGTALANSSTNYNRKRAAYVLKRFFCDDLTPVGFDDPKEHAGGAHGSQTSCYSCHYKLDPMAGFFRNYGALFSDASASPDIVFDDLASMDRTKYLAAWSAPPGAGRAWEVGYIRSPRWTEANSYGSSLADLSKIIRNAPEAKRCLMKRLSEYVLGPNQTVDGGYIDFLTRKFTEEAAQNSSHALKNAMIRIIGSKTYAVRNPDPAQCYDLAPGASAENRPPCRVAYIVEKNCAQCHDGKDIQNALDLSKWIAAPSGHGKTFQHVNAKGEQRPAVETFNQMAQRLATTDAKLRMPKNKPMSSQERQDLYLWLEGEIARLGKGRQ